MVGQLRIYTINKGMAESWLKLFHEVIAPKTLEFGMGIQSAWMDEEKERFIWIRTYESLEDIKVKDIKSNNCMILIRDENDILRKCSNEIMSSSSVNEEAFNVFSTKLTTPG